LKRINVMPGDITPGDDAVMHTVVETPEDFIVVAAGSRAGAFSAFIPGWGGKRTSRSITKEIHRP
jgi:hypothetical protein